jgi:hypothetical protein
LSAPSQTASEIGALPGSGGLSWPPIADGELRRRYADYRRRQARALLSIIPREGVRPLYRRALRSRRYDGIPASGDSLEALLVSCEELLPLPPYEVWVEDLRRYPSAHLVELDQSAEAPTAAAPVTLAVRRFHSEGVDWRAKLSAFRDGVAWRGFIDFESGSEDAMHRRSRTALIFREVGPADLRSSFMAFSNGSLAAFLRSTLP